MNPLTAREYRDFNIEIKSKKDREEIALAETHKNMPEKLKTYYLENFKHKFYRETLIQSQVADDL